MKKTISINLRGIHFIIEEGGYERLQAYLKKLETTLGKTEGKQEIIEDIETRIAELFSDNMDSNSKQVIELQDVEKAIETLGEPEDYIDEEDVFDEGSNKSFQYEQTGGNRKLYRDIENANIAGVAAGLSNYFKLNPMVMRVLFIFGVLFAGFGVPLYIILWVVMPKATSNIDRLRMKGRPVTVESVREEVESAAHRMKSNSRKVARKLERESDWQNRFSSLGRIISVGLGLFTLFLCVMLSVAFAVLVIGQFGVTPVHGVTGLYSIREFMELFYDSQKEVDLIWWTGIIFALISIAYLLSLGIRLLSGLKMPWFKYLSRTYIIMMVVTVIMGFYNGTILAKEFTMESQRSKEIVSVSDSLTVNIVHHKIIDEEYLVDQNHPFWLSIQDEMILDDGVRLKTRPSKDSLFHVRLEYKSNGSTNQEAFRNAKNIVYDIKADSISNTIDIPTYFMYPVKDKIRAQRIQVYIEVPKGKTIQFNDINLNRRFQRNWDRYDFDEDYEEFYLGGHHYYRDSYNVDW